jgi:long-chain acyl-CoA synthetase
VTSPALAADLEPVAAALDRPPAIVVAEAAGVEVRRAGTGGAPALAGGASPPLLQQYTSGSTGTPKRIVRSHADLVHELGALREVFGLTEADRVLGVTPFSHVNGLVRTMMTSMSCGARLYPLPHFLRRRVLALLARERLTFFGGVPYMFAILAETAGDDGADLSALRVVFSSSAPLTPADGERFLARYGVAVRQLYGSTETGTIAFNRDADPRATMRSVGTPLPGVRISVVDDADRPVPPGREGQVVVASPFAASGYLGDPDASRLAFRDAGCRSGDLGILDSGGALTLTGRTRLVINRGGFKVNPYEVEDAIRSHPSVRDVAVFGAPTAHGDETVCCVIVPGRPCSPEDIVVHCRDRIADFKIPTWISFADALPRSATGKVLRARLAAAV